MAILENVRGIKVTVCTDGQALQEYDDDAPEGVPAGVEGYDEAPRTVSKYIESATGKAFYIKLEISKAYKFDSPIVSFQDFVDGIKVSSKHGGKKDIPLTIKLRGARMELDNRQAFVMPFKFSGIITSTNDSKLASIKEDATRLSVVGEIVIKVHRRGPRVVSQNQSSKLNASKKFAADSSASVHEKALKGQAISHNTTLGAPQAAKATVLYKMSYRDGKEHPIAIYRFKYRSKESLKSLLILERAPEPSPSPSPAPGNGAQSNRERKIKREREETNSKTNKRSKRGERVEIDLTGDQSD
ncbi:hypothetical protein BOTCAL_0202g00170 [Botryotinia calthae]|uniref:DUF7918 domain-containing protein n=1 Tax=Botryotinia calthae TaxID=38488 RepID=A0A4Y8CZ93_9HELO|nr:hypothetical protein BOTCAL_0202g00170 [Botryotinia calthae]